MSEASGVLSIVATPIGNLEDITLRALRVLREADLVLAEDTRRTRVLCQQHGVNCQLRAFHAHSDERAQQRVLDELQQGKRVALVTDAGTPLLSDPGAALVAAAARAGLRVEAIPGASAITAALTVAAVPVDTFRFLGFLPRSGRKRSAALSQLASEADSCVIFESPQRLLETLEEFARVLGPERSIAACRELTKLHEEVVRGSATELVRHFSSGVRGEITLVVAGRGAAPVVAVSDADIERRALELLDQGLSTRDAAQTLALETGQRKHELYARITALKTARSQSRTD